MLPVALHKMFYILAHYGLLTDMFEQSVNASSLQGYFVQVNLYLKGDMCIGAAHMGSDVLAPYVILHTDAQRHKVGF